MMKVNCLTILDHIAESFCFVGCLEKLKIFEILAAGSAKQGEELPGVSLHF